MKRVSISRRHLPISAVILTLSNAKGKDPCIPPAVARKPAFFRYLWLAGFLLLGMAAQSFGQGCTQCLDNTRSTPPSVQAAYRHAIYLLGGVGATLFVAGTIFLRRER